MFNVVEDPECMSDLAGDPAYRELKEALNRQMVAELREQEDPRMFGRGHIFDEYEYADPSTAGFYERFMKGEKIKAGWTEPSDFEKGPVEE